MQGKSSSLVILLAWGVFFLFIAKYALPAEDAVILYSYAKNLAHTGIITYSANTSPIEGATDFLWMLLIGLGSYIGMDEYLCALILSLFSICGLLYLLSRQGISFRLTTLALLLTPYLYASLFGFSTLFFSLIYVLALSFALRRHRFFYATLCLLCLIRPDGLVWGMGLILFRVVQEKKLEWRSLLIAFVLPFVVYWIWRTWYFGELWPLPFIVKGFDNHQTWFFYDYSLICIMLVAQPIFLSIFCFAARRKLARDACVLFIIPCLFYGMMRLEQNVGNRLLAPMFWGWLFYLGGQSPCDFLKNTVKQCSKQGALCVFILCSMAYASLITFYTLQSLLKSPYMNVYQLATKLDDFLPGRMLVSEAGRLAYYSHWSVEDSWGLNTPYYAHHFIHRADLVKGHHDLIVTHGDLTILNDDKKYSLLPEKTWRNQTKILISYLRTANYDIYLVPYYNIKKMRCARYDIYGVSREFHSYHRLVKLLKEHGGILYTPTINVLEDEVCI